MVMWLGMDTFTKRHPESGHADTADTASADGRTIPSSFDKRDEASSQVYLRKLMISAFY